MNCEYYVKLKEPIYVKDVPVYNYCQKDCNECKNCTKNKLDNIIDLSQRLQLYEE